MKEIITFIIFCLVLTGGSAILFFIPMFILMLAEVEGATAASTPFELEWYWIVGIIAYFILSLKLIYKLSRAISHKIVELLKLD